MQMKRPISSLAVAALLLAGYAGSALSQTTSSAIGNSITTPSSSVVNPATAGQSAHTNIQILAMPATFTGSPQTNGPPVPGFFYETPSSIACIYDLEPQVPGCNPSATYLNPNGGKKAIAIVDAYDDPNAAADLEAFSRQFGVPGITSTSFKIVYAPVGLKAPGSCAKGTAPRPPFDPTGGWELEESLDIEWAHAMAPEATLYLVEAQSNSFPDLFCAVSVASKLVASAGGGEVSMSWGGSEYKKETDADVVFSTNKVVYLAAAGDTPGAEYPSASPNVVSVGGTTISRNPFGGSFEGYFNIENGWQDGGGGPSAYEPRPNYQNAIANMVGNSRGTPDVALDANPNTGVWVLNNFNPSSACAPGCWYIVGGTSVAVQVFTGIVNAASTFAASSYAELTKLYGDSLSDFNDITMGNCGPYAGFFATGGWDFCTGLGSPRTYVGK